MSTLFPAGLDSFTNPTPSNPQNSPSHSAQHSNANDAIAALEKKVGITSSADASSLDHRVATLESGSGHMHVSGETPSGTINGSNVTFTIAQTPRNPASLMLFYNGLLQNPGGNDFTLSGTTITFVSAPLTNSVLLAHYIV